MKHIKMRILLLSLLVGLNSCTPDELVGTVPEGEPAIVNLQVNMAHMGSAQTRAMTPAQETAIKTVRVMIFDSSNKIVTNQKFASYPAGGLKLTTLSGNNRSIYVVANATATTDATLAAIAQVSELEEKLVAYTDFENDIIKATQLMMTGKTAAPVNITPGTNFSHKIKMEFLAAKVKLKVVDGAGGGSKKVTFLGYEVVDAPTSSYLLSKADKLTSAVYYKTAMPASFDDTLSATLYLLENKSGGRVVNEEYPPSGENIGSNNPKDKRHFAPKLSTYIKIYTLFEELGDAKRMDVYVYLGANTSHDYNVLRGTIYEITVTVTGFSEIDINSNVGTPKLAFKSSIGDLRLDTHADSRGIYLSSDVAGTAVVEVVDDAGRTYDQPGFSAKWLTVSPLNLLDFQVKQAGNGKQQDVAPTGALARPKYTPINANSYNMKFAVATYNMCYRITDIPVATTTPYDKVIYLYADEYYKDAATTSNRFASIRVTFLPTGKTDELSKVTYRHGLNQCGYHAVFNSSAKAGILRLDRNGYPFVDRPLYKKFVVEQIEEARTRRTAYTVPNPPSAERSETMQWGFSSEVVFGDADKYRSGSVATAAAVLSYFNRYWEDLEPAWDPPAEYRAKYDRSSAGAIAEKGIAHGGAPYYLPTATPLIYDPIYNISAARYCFEKNRDTDGDGEISSAEMLWYLPSQHELELITIANNDRDSNEGMIIGGIINEVHWSSTEHSDAKAFYVSFSPGGSSVEFSKKERGYVRCIRKWTNPSQP